MTLSGTEIKLSEELKGLLLYLQFNILEAQKAADIYNKKHETVAFSMPVLLQGFPYVYNKGVVANSEDYSGPDIDGIFGSRGECVVATRHGGKEGKWGLLTHDIISSAYAKYEITKDEDKTRGLNAMYAAILDDLYNTNVFCDMLRGNMPDGRTIRVFSYAQLVAGECPQDGSEYVVVRPLSLAKKTESGHDSISRLVDKNGKVTDSQVITYAGGVVAAQSVVDTAKEKCNGMLGVRHPFNQRNFDPNQNQGRMLYVGTQANGFIGDHKLGCYHRDLDTSRFMVGKIPDGRKKQYTEQLVEGKNFLANPTLEEVLSVGRQFVSKDSYEKFEEAMKKLYPQ